MITLFHIKKTSSVGSILVISSLEHLFFFLITRGVRASLHAPRLIPGPTEHPASPVDR